SDAPLSRARFSASASTNSPRSAVGMILPPDQNDSGGLWRTVRAILINCITLHYASVSGPWYFLSSPSVFCRPGKEPVFRRVLPLKSRVWLGGESNRRHVDFQSTALPTELPSRDGADGVAPWGFHYATMPW